ncbi:hypothetical protein ACHWQZ_G018415 [Mnemiopsis leidyi]
MRKFGKRSYTIQILIFLQILPSFSSSCDPAESNLETEDEIVDSLEAFRLTKAYLCTGNKEWSLQIKNPALRWFIRVLQNGLCWTGDSWGEHYTPASFIREIDATFRDIKITGNTSKCFWDVFRQVMTSTFCEKGTTRLEVLTKMLLLSWCRDYPEEPLARAFCGLGDHIILQSNEIKSNIGKYICMNQHNGGCNEEELGRSEVLKLVKRQYDLSSLVSLLESIMCKHPESMAEIARGGGIKLSPLIDSDRDLKVVVQIIGKIGCCGTLFVRETEHLG